MTSRTTSLATEVPKSLLYTVPIHMLQEKRLYWKTGTRSWDLPQCEPAPGEPSHEPVGGGADHYVRLEAPPMITWPPPLLWLSIRTPPVGSPTVRRAQASDVRLKGGLRVLDDAKPNGWLVTPFRATAEAQRSLGTPRWQLRRTTRAAGGAEWYSYTRKRICYIVYTTAGADSRLLLQPWEMDPETRNDAL